MDFMIPALQNLSRTFKHCMAHAVERARASGLTEAAIAVHSKQNVIGGAIEQVLGERDTRRLLRGSVVRDGITWHLITERRTSSLTRGPMIIAYVGPEYLKEVLQDDRATDFIFLPWNRKDEAEFYYTRSPQVISAPSRWTPLKQRRLSPVEREDRSAPSHEIRLHLTPEQRLLDLTHSIDPGFVNFRRIEAIIGDAGRSAINEQVRRLPHMPEWQRDVRIGHIYSDIMLAFCRVHEVPPLGRLLHEQKGKLFCSTERLGPCRDIYAAERGVNLWRPERKVQQRVEFHYSAAQVTSDTLRSQLRRGDRLSMIAELHSVTHDRVIFHPLVMGGPWLSSADPKWKNAAMWWAGEFYENVVEDFDNFAALRLHPKPLSCEPMRQVSEHAFKKCLAEIIGGEVPKDWGGETSDFYSAHLRLGGKRVSGAFLLKGPARFSPMRLNSLGKNNDQIVRLSAEPADVLFVQHCHEITPAVRETLRVFAVQPSRPRRYCLIDGRDSLWLLNAHGLYERAVQWSRKKPA
jgi:hypothetical protein